MYDTLTYNAKAGTLSALIGGRLIVVPALRAEAGRIVGWDKVQELRTGAHRSGGGYVLTSVQHTARGADGDPDSPFILGRLPNASRGPGSSHSGGINVLMADGSVRGAAGALHLHAWPPRAHAAIVVVRGWDPLKKALEQTRQVTLIVEM